MKRLLVISPHWPPVNAPDHQRVRMSLPFYQEQRWKATILVSDPRDVHATLEPELEATVPEDADVRPVRIDLPWLWGLLGIGSLGLRSLSSLWRNGSRLLRGEHYDLVFFSNTQFLTFILGPWWRWRFGTPYIIDLQDPWRTDYYERPGAPVPPGGWKYQFARLLAWIFEPLVYRWCSGFISVSQRYLDDLRKRYSWFAGKPSRIIFFGASLRDMEIARIRPHGPNHFKKNPDEIHLLYTGAAGPIMPHALNTLFRGFHAFKQRHPDDARHFRFHFYGTSYVAPGCGWPSVMPVAEHYGLANVVDEIPHRIGHLESLSLQMHTDVLVMLGSSDLAYSPSKLYPYYLAGKPMLAIVFTGSYLESLLATLVCAQTVSFLPEVDTERVDAELFAYFKHLAETHTAPPLPARNQEAFESLYLSERLTQIQCRFFEHVLRAHQS